MANTNIDYSNRYAITLRSCTVAFVIGLVFLTKTTGALQAFNQATAVKPPNTGQLTADGKQNTGIALLPGGKTVMVNTATGVATDVATGEVLTLPPGTVVTPLAPPKPKVASGNNTTTPGSGSTGGGTTTGGDTTTGGGTTTPDPTPTPTPDPTPDPTPTPTPTPTPPPPPPPPPPPAPTYTYRNGTYYAEPTFGTPGGTQRMGVTLVIFEDNITDSSITKLATGGTSQYWENEFVNNYRPAVIGKKLAGLNINRVAGASLTTQGFNSALNSIRSQAAF